MRRHEAASKADGATVTVAVAVAETKPEAAGVGTEAAGVATAVTAAPTMTRTISDTVPLPTVDGMPEATTASTGGDAPDGTAEGTAEGTPESTPGGADSGNAHGADGGTTHGADGGEAHGADGKAPAKPGGGRRRGSHRSAPANGRPRRRRRRTVIGAVAAGLVLMLGALGLVALTTGSGDQRRTSGTAAPSPRPATATGTADAPPAPEPAEPEPTSDGPAAPGVRWPSGTNANPPLDIWAWDRWTGRASDIAVIFTIRNNWQHIVFSDWPLSNYPKSVFPGQVSVAQPLFPESGNERSCANGQYDQYWAAFGQTLTRNGRPDAIVRLGWEYNGNWFWWHPRNTETWKTCFQRAVTAIRSTAPGVLIDFNVSAHRDRMTNGDDVWAAYPGDGYVDIVSSDVYDSYPPSTTAELFDEQCNVPSGTCTVINFARAHGKKFAVPEWGLARADRHGGGDNPLFIEKMHDLFDQNRDILAYEAYFNTSESNNVRSSLLNPQLHPNSAQRYLELFGATASGGGI
ncbi:glycoside hydrolase family 26 protein [Parafrankia sp. EUN1f]|uniref:glycoside hydrolase family 26 protein n=1 Tax=Parafrankia sp. EUN1f TaxID=102897 RepID=UPI001E63D999|nr:glycosyl hydrolase [Parafrankia sp. EUN1f]